MKMRIFAILFLATITAYGSAVAEVPARAKGWTIGQGKLPHECAASGPKDRLATLDIAALGGAFLLLIHSADLPRAKATYPLSLVIDGGHSVGLSAMGADSTMGVSIGGDLARAVGSATRLAVIVGGKGYVFTVHDAQAAMDAVARYAGAPTLAEREIRRLRPIPLAGEWRLSATLPGVTGSACTARINGDQVDTILMINRSGQLLLVAGHNGWAAWGGELDVSLQIDGDTPDKLKAFSFNNLVMTEVTNETVLLRLRRARTLDWSLPLGHFHAAVSGLGIALDAVKACQGGQSDGGSAKPHV